MNGDFFIFPSSSFLKLEKMLRTVQNKLSREYLVDKVHHFPFWLIELTCSSNSLAAHTKDVMAPRFVISTCNGM